MKKSPLTLRVMKTSRLFVEFQKLSPEQMLHFLNPLELLLYIHTQRGFKMKKVMKRVQVNSTSRYFHKKAKSVQKSKKFGDFHIKNFNQPILRQNQERISAIFQRLYSKKSSIDFLKMEKEHNNRSSIVQKISRFPKLNFGQVPGNQSSQSRFRSTNNSFSKTSQKFALSNQTTPLDKHLFDALEQDSFDTDASSIQRPNHKVNRTITTNKNPNPYNDFSDNIMFQFLLSRSQIKRKKQTLEL
ncbi:UNKNOWN [Stylonychia lemnae]|uniref:Uncharacterized protein n=1 Tax=Stylonychia lemnae TaxID=5949 RepID=A0A077ZSN6_STYLE|nr:UNKNOWN [Stylonychia lemnae]|eukprot:CDW72320.1 UNKNOWN [Stylonychia lemnae]